MKERLSPLGLNELLDRVANSTNFRVLILRLLHGLWL